jgi:hypothetical protein
MAARLLDSRLCGRPAVVTVAQNAGTDDGLVPAGGCVYHADFTDDVPDEEGTIRADRDCARRGDFSVEARPAITPIAPKTVAHV